MMINPKQEKLLLAASVVYALFAAYILWSEPVYQTYPPRWPTTPNSGWVILQKYWGFWLSLLAFVIVLYTSERRKP